jgi:carbon dioxide concentrating mechanism protein CcmN
MVGQGKIGTNACIGALTTIWNASIEPWQVVPPGSLVGDQGRQVPTPALVSNSVTETPPPASTDTKSQESLNGQVPTPTTVVSNTAHADSSTELPAEAATTELGKSVYGQENLNRLLKTLFPYNNQSFNPPPEDS